MEPPVPDPDAWVRRRPMPDAHAHSDIDGHTYTHAHRYAGPHRHAGAYPHCFPDSKRDPIWDAIFSTGPYA